MNSDIKDDLGKQIHQEISRSFEDNLAGIADLIKDNFQQIRGSFQLHQDGLQNI